MHVTTLAGNTLAANNPERPIEWWALVLGLGLIGGLTLALIRAVHLLDVVADEGQRIGYVLGYAQAMTDLRLTAPAGPIAPGAAPSRGPETR